MSEVLESPASPARPATYRARRALALAERRERALERIPPAARVDPQRVEDPLAREAREANKRAGIPIWVGASFALHIGIVVLGFIVPASAQQDRAFEQAVEMLEAPKPPPTVTAAAPEPPTPPPNPIVAQPAKTPAKPPPPTKDEPPPDPIQATAPDPEPAAKPARRIIGLNLDSTVTGGGPSFAIGNTRMGETSRTAGDPNAAAALPGAQFVPPRRIHEVQPDYPPPLRAQNVEGEVGLKVDVDATGHVTNVVVVVPSPEPAFNTAAVAAAKASAYSPALMNATPVANTIQFTVRFRLKH